MYKRILTVQDISCVGQCSMTVALPILSACGVETCILPTALLSTHTGGFQNPEVHQMAELIPDFSAHWKREGITFDAIYTGYLGSVAAVDAVLLLAKELLVPGGALIVDPAMADHGRMYRGLDEEYAEAMVSLCRRADIVLPNVTEAAMLSGRAFCPEPDAGYIADLLQGIENACVIMTGVGYSGNETGVLVREHGQIYHYTHPKVAGNYHGTGDIFAACFTGALMRGLSMKHAAQLAANFTAKCIEVTSQSPAHFYGTKFETVIPMLIRMLDVSQAVEG